MLQNLFNGISLPSNINLSYLLLTAYKIQFTCYATTDKTSGNKRLNSSKHDQAPH